MRFFLAASALAAALATASPRVEVGAGPDAGVPDAPAGLDAQPVDPCAEIVARIERRKAFLEARRHEQFQRGGEPDPEHGRPNMLRAFCEEHPGDPDCALPPLSIIMSTDELVWVPDASFDDYEPHVIAFTRELRACRARKR